MECFGFHCLSALLLRRRDLPNNGTAVMRLSPELKDLLDKMFEVKQVGVSRACCFISMIGKGLFMCRQTRGITVQLMKAVTH